MSTTKSIDRFFESVYTWNLHVGTFRSFINGEWPECALDGPFHPDGFFLEFHRGVVTADNANYSTISVSLKVIFSEPGLIFLLTDLNADSVCRLLLEEVHYPSINSINSFRRIDNILLGKILDKHFHKSIRSAPPHLVQQNKQENLSDAFPGWICESFSG